MRRQLKLLLVLVWGCAGQSVPDVTGTWVYRSSGVNIVKITLANGPGGITGSLTRPKKLSIQDGDVTEIGEEQVTFPVQKAKLTGAVLELTIDDDAFIFTWTDGDRATLSVEGLSELKLERVSGEVTLATHLPEAHYSEEIRALRERMHAMVKEDQDARLAFDMPRAERADAKNRAEVLAIFSKYGWVTYSLAGKDAAHDYWLLVQHQTPEIQQRLLPALEKAAKAGDASMTDYAYLYDRVQAGLGKPQHWGSQTECKNGRPVLSPVDDPDGLDARRKELHLPPVQEYLKMDYLVKSCAGAK